jgi:hypothetical protein
MQRRNRTKIAMAALVLAFLLLPGLVTVFTLQYNTSIKMVVMPAQSSSMAYDQSNGLLYISALYEDKVYAYNSTSLQLESTISTNGMIEYQDSSGELFDPFNGLLYVAGLGINVSGITVINTTDNSVAGVINFGGNNFTGNMVLGNDGILLVSEGVHITEINGTHIIANYSTGTMYNDAISYAFDATSNTSYLVYDFQGLLMAANDLHNLNGTDVRYVQMFSYPTYMKYSQDSGKLLLASSNHLYAISPSNISDILFRINLENNAGGVSATMCSSSTGLLYVATYGSEAIYVYNSTTGRYVGSMRQTDTYNPVTGIIQVSNDRMVASVGNRLVLEGETPSNLQPNLTDLEVALAVSAGIVGPVSVLVYFVLKRYGK